MADTGGSQGKAGEVEEGLGRVPFRGRDGGSGSGAMAGEVAVGGEIGDAEAGGEESEIGFEAALEAGEGGIVGEKFGEGAAGAGELAAQGS